MDTQKVRALLLKDGDNRFSIAVEMADGDDGELSKLAKEYRVVVSTYYGWRIGGKCWLGFREFYGEELADKWRDLLPVSFWIAVGRKVEAKIFDFEDVMDWFKDALDNDWNVQQFRDELYKTTIVKDFDFVKEAEHVEKRYFQFVAFGATQEQVGRIVKAAHELHDALLAVGENDNGK
jgi:hypothetical protein